MSEHIEWAEAAHTGPDIASPNELHDGHGNTNEKHALCFDTGSSTMAIEGTKAELVKLAEQILEACKDIETGFIATVNVPGYLPQSDDTPWFETEREAWEYLADLRRDSEDDSADENFEGYSATLNQLECLQRGEWEQQFSWSEGTGTVQGPTPGYDGDHDLGLNYTVSEAE